MIDCGGSHFDGTGRCPTTLEEIKTHCRRRWLRDQSPVLKVMVCSVAFDQLKAELCAGCYFSGPIDCLWVLVLKSEKGTILNWSDARDDPFLTVEIRRENLG